MRKSSLVLLLFVGMTMMSCSPIYCGDKLILLSKDTARSVETMIQTQVKKEQARIRENKEQLNKIDLVKHFDDLMSKKKRPWNMLSKKEIKILQRIVEAEATDKNQRSKILVANVVLNRVRSKEFPDSVKKVVFQKVHGQVQFSPIADGRYEQVRIHKSTEISVWKALQGKDYSHGALYFVEKSMANANNVSWFDRALQPMFTYEGHSFYK